MLQVTRVFYQPSDYETVATAYWKGRTVVVIDVLRATSTLVTALASGYAEARCFRELQSARDYAAQHPGVVLAGEREGLPPEGFEKGNSPREFTTVGGAGIVLSTSNGTRALDAAAGAQRVIIASLLNLGAVADFLRRAGGEFDVVCSGTGEAFALEDALVAGALVEELGLPHAMAALYRSCADRLGEVFRQSKNGRRLLQIGLEADIAWCLQRDLFPVVPLVGLDGGIRLKTGG